MLHPVTIAAMSSLRLSVGLVALALALPVAADDVDLPRFPSVSPDGREVVFSWRGDLWKVPSQGGAATRLTSHPQDDLASAWSPDGSLIGFESERDGFRNLFVMKTDGTGLRQVTELDRDAALAGFGRRSDGSLGLTFTSTLQFDLYRSGRPYMVSVDGGDAEVVHGAFGSAPLVSPDGTRVLFERGGSAWFRRHYRGPDQRDVWLFDRRDDSFRKLTTWEGNDGQPRWAGNDAVFFLSDRVADTVNVFRMDLAGGEPTVAQVTRFTDADVIGFDLSADGNTLIAHQWDSLFRWDLAAAAPGGAGQKLSITAAADAGDSIELRDVSRNVTESALNPDGKSMAMIAFGDVYVRSIDDKSPTRAITRSESRERDLAWSPDGLTLYFVSDESGREEIRAATVTSTRSELREVAKKATSSEPTPDAPAVAAVARGGERGAAGESEASAHADPPAEPAAAAAPAGTETSAKTDSTGKPSAEEKPDPKLNPARWSEAVQFDVQTVVSDALRLRRPSPSPDGMSLAFRRGLGDLVIRSLGADGTGSEERVLVPGWDTSIEWQWSPDSRWIAFSQHDRNFNNDVFIIPADGSAAPINITRHPDNDGRPRWSADGKVLAFLSERNDNTADVWMVYLDKSMESLTPMELEKYYKDAAEETKKRKPLKPVGQKLAKAATGGDAPPDAVAEAKPELKPDAKADDESDDAQKASKTPAKTPAKIEPLDPAHLADAYLRLRRVTNSPGAEGGLEITPAGDRYIFTAAEEGGGLFSLKWDGTDRKKLGPAGSVEHLSLTGDKVVVVSGGRASHVKPEGGEQKFVDIDATIVIDRADLASRKFQELARTLGAEFYHPTMKGLDWEALTGRYLTLARASRTPDEFNWISSRFLGELNASHLGVTSPDPASPIRQAQGRIGTTHTRVADGVRIDRVFSDSPAALSSPAILPGDLIVAVEFEAFGPTDTLESALRGRTGRETALTVRRPNEASPREFTVLLTPISFEAQRRLAYNDWQNQTREQVAAWSDGRIGYIHIEAMDQPQLDSFERDLFAAAEGRSGLIVDVRNNGGGWTADRLLSSIMVQPHAYTVPRGMSDAPTDGYPQDRLFIQRYSLPMNMLCNEKSFSNAEITAHAFRTLKRGTLVGQKTYGGVISTDAFRLVDGTTVRLPFRGWYLSDGTDMENNGAVPDIVVPMTPQAEAQNSDEQLKAAVEELRSRMG